METDLVVITVYCHCCGVAICDDVVGAYTDYYCDQCGVYS